jgi:hypothetical protein
MAEGGRAIRERGEAVADGLILDDEAIAQTERLRIAQDDLQDSVHAITFALSQRLIPALASWSEEMARGLSTTREEVNAAEELGRRFFDLSHHSEALNAQLNQQSDALDGLHAQISALPTHHAVDIPVSIHSNLDSVAQAILDRWGLGYFANYLMGGGQVSIGGVIYGAQSVAGMSNEQLAGMGSTGLSASRQATNEWRTSHGYRAWTAEQFAAAGMQHGGPLGPIALVGERGPELVVDGVVIPADETRRLMALGLAPDEQYQKGGTYTKTGPAKKTYTGTKAPASQDTKTITETLGLTSLTPSTETTATTAAAAAQVVAAETAASIPQAAAAASASAVQASTAAQVAASAEQTNAMRAMQRTLERIERELPRQFRDAVSSLVQ